MTTPQAEAFLRVMVMADTHLRDPQPARLHGSPRGTTRDLPAAVWQRLERCDVILHAGDVLEIGLLQRLAKVAPTYAVLGNNDLSLTAQLPVTRVVGLGGVRIGMIHDSGPTAGRAGRMRRRFPDAVVVVFGHSHAPCDDVGMDGQRLFNPGSPTQRRAQPVHTMGELVISGGALTEHRIIDLGR
jgi:putative phosphoesterase